MSGRMIYELLVRIDGERHVVRLEAATIAEALDRASKVWCGGEVQLLGTIDPQPQVFLAW